MPDWLDPATLRDAIIGVLGGLAILALLVLRFIRKVILRVVVIGVLGAAALVLYVERESLADCAHDCSCDFLGFEVEVPACRERDPIS